MIYFIMILFFAELVIVARYRWRVEWDISPNQTKKEVIAGIILFAVIVILAKTYSDAEKEPKKEHGLSELYQSRPR